MAPRRVLITGSSERVETLAKVFERAGDEPVTLAELGPAGNLPAETAAPDDRAARLLMLRVLGHAIRADLAPKRVRVRVVSAERTDEEIVDFALSGAKDPQAEHPSLLNVSATARSYQDWRTEILGLAQVEI